MRMISSRTFGGKRFGNTTTESQQQRRRELEAMTVVMPGNPMGNIDESNTHFSRQISATTTTFFPEGKFKDKPDFYI